jgi:hypothetical protein
MGINIFNRDNYNFISPCPFEIGRLKASKNSIIIPETNSDDKIIQEYEKFQDEKWIEEKHIV